MSTMTKKIKRTSHSSSYSLNEVKELVADYVDASADRLRSRLRHIWKKQASLKLPVYAKNVDAFFRTGTR